MSNRDNAFMEIPRKEPGYRPREERVKDWRAVELQLSDEAIREQTARCMDCGIPFCHGCGCPLLNVIPEFNDHVYAGRWQQALDILETTNPFPEFTGRICPAPCEGSCVVGIHGSPVTIRQAELMIAEKGFELGLIHPRPPARRHTEKIAVVGSGPAGLGAANALNRMGYHVTVYENAEHPGGILRYGIPDFKLEKWVVERRVDLMRQEGVRFETGVEVGKDVSARFLHSRFDAVILTGGARQPRDLKIPGRELNGIHFAMTYLIQQNRRLEGAVIPPEKEIMAKNKDVLVIGGGDTGSDCLGTALRQGARSVIQMEIMPRPPDNRSPQTPWPEWPVMLRESSSHKEGGERRWGMTATAFEGGSDSVAKVHCVEVEWKAPDGGRPAPHNVKGSETVLNAQLVLLAMGFSGPGRNQYVEELGLEMDNRGFIKRDSCNMTSEAGVFTAGDMTQGASLVVRAIADGITVARNVNRYLQAKTSDKNE
jgi:glutamate synthase (NADPH) small chain